MSDTETFRQWLERVRGGDQDAATELVRRYEPAIHEVIRLRLIELRLYRMLDARDICQSVLAHFFTRILGNRFVIDSSEQLQALLRTMARNKVQDEARRQHADRRDCRRIDTAFSEDGLDNLMADGPTPSTIVAGQELVVEIKRRFTAEEQELFEERSLGRDWAAIAAARGANPETLRKKLARAIHRVLGQLRLTAQCLT